MAATLIYVVGASGSGKDSLLGYARQRLAQNPLVCFAHRYITRPAAAGGENHVALSPEEFDARARAGLFALHWRSHGLCYGIGIEIDQWLARGVTVVVNGSRGHLRPARRRYPALLAVLVEASETVLRERLHARGRETVEEIERRLQRNRLLALGAAVDVVLRNEGALETAGEALVGLIRSHSRAVACA